ncbi:MAG: hypothetical protein KDB00_16035 [Planctomycetales bacterium]|nr:hypothetical protein [Planctomycetales bacterium]
MPPVSSILALAGIAVVVLGAGVQTAIAQGQEFGAPSTVPGNEITNFKGKLKGMQRGIILVEKEDGTEAMVAPPENVSSFQFVAKATPAFLQRGMLIRMDANFGPGGVPLSPVTKVTLFQPVDPRGVQGKAKEQFTPGVYSDAKAGDRRNQPMVGKLSIVGQLIGLSPSGILAVQAGKVPVQVPVNAETELEVRYNNLTLAQEGDPVTVAGFYQPPNENEVRADRITITTDRVYGEYQPPKNDRRSKRKRKDDDDNGKPDGDDGEQKGDEKADAKIDVKEL